MTPFILLGVFVTFFLLFLLSSVSCFIYDYFEKNKKEWGGIPLYVALRLTLLLIFFIVILFVMGGGMGAAIVIVYGGHFITIVLAILTVLTSLYRYSKLESEHST